ncbi:MAG: hypothetical protein J6D54_03105 [Olsenella sp.]|nr:hypothetical protein [Olsenella sp.]
MARERRYEIRLLDRTLVEFSVTGEPGEEQVALVDYDETALSLMPYGLSLDGAGILGWMSSRAMPHQKAHHQEVCEALGIARSDVMGAYQAGLGLSLNDGYWVVPSGYEGTFTQLNLYDNVFPEAIAEVAYAGHAESAGQLCGPSPDLVTDGTLAKAWRIEPDGTRALYKGSTPGFSPGEDVSEVAISNLAESVGADHVRYTHASWMGTDCSVCPCFATKDLSYSAFAVATGLTGLAGALWACKNLSTETFEALCDMLTLDAITLNVDRHLSNFGFMRDNATGELVGLAPIFDNGRGLLPNLSDDELDGIWTAADVCTPAFGDKTFINNVGRFVGERQRELAERVLCEKIDFSGLASRKRERAMTELVHERAREIAELPLVDREELFSALDGASARFAPGPGRTHRARESYGHDGPRWQG